MDAFEEAVERAVRIRSEQAGGLSPKAIQELELSVRAHPDEFLTSAPEQALLILDKAIRAQLADRAEDELRDDKMFDSALKQRSKTLRSAAESALAIDPRNLDAQLLRIIGTYPTATAKEELRYQELKAVMETIPRPEPSQSGMENDVFCQPWLRAMEALTRWAYEATHFRQAGELGRELLTACPSDPYGCRHTLALVYARLEDETALDELDRFFARKGSAWIALARTILLYKLDRIGAARRALLGYVRLYPGGAFALANPSFVDEYLPNRPDYAPLSFDEAVLAVREAALLIEDVPFFLFWCFDQESFAKAEEEFARHIGYDER